MSTLFTAYSTELNNNVFGLCVQVDCAGCMRGCCQKLTEVLRNMER